jgi:hypothetical protein
VQADYGEMSKVAMMMLGMALAAGGSKPAPVCEARSGANTGALVELYTSEGCSSCPPADRWFAKLAASANPRELSLLAFHVDYWDEIGWPDRLAQRAFTLRQSQRVRAGGSTTIYTPQVMLSSQLGLRWNQPAQVAAAIAAIQHKPATLSLRLEARPDSGRWRVDLDASPLTGVAGAGQMYLALYEDGLSSNVRAGENTGLTLHHERVVRGLWGPWPVSAKGSATQHLQVSPPSAARAGKLGLTAFVQNPRTGETLQALSLPLGACASSSP